tara:strand:- start:229 stop:399 length:171 start_codon:yes stop_codon:yes gene_type:complete
MANEIWNKCLDMIETGHDDLTESILFDAAISCMSNESKTRFMNKLIEMENKAYPDE